MPKRKGKSKKKAIMVLLVIIIVSVGVVAWHDGAIGTTKIADINHGDVDTGTRVTVKGKLTLRVGNIHTVTALDSSNTLIFVWDGDSPALDSIIVVRGTVASTISLDPVTSVQTVWLITS